MLVLPEISMQDTIAVTRCKPEAVTAGCDVLTQQILTSSGLWVRARHLTTAPGAMAVHAAGVSATKLVVKL